jgi:hypothetical protein
LPPSPVSIKSLHCSSSSPRFSSAQQGLAAYKESRMMHHVMRANMALQQECHQLRAEADRRLRAQSELKHQLERKQLQIWKESKMRELEERCNSLEHDLKRQHEAESRRASTAHTAAMESLQQRYEVRSAQPHSDRPLKSSVFLAPARVPALSLPASGPASCVAHPPPNVHERTGTGLLRHHST